MFVFVFVFVEVQVAVRREVFGDFARTHSCGGRRFGIGRIGAAFV